MSEIAGKTPGVEATFAVTGLNLLTGTTQTNVAVIFLPLKGFQRTKGKAGRNGSRHRGVSDGEISATSRKLFRSCFLPPPVQGIGQAGGFKMQVEDRSGLATPQQLRGGHASADCRSEQEPADCGGFQLVSGERSAAVCQR